jgi:hypothetical protein
MWSAVDFMVDPREFGETNAAAIERAKALAKQPSTLGGIPLTRLALSKATFFFHQDGSDDWGELKFRGTLARPVPFPFTPGVDFPGQAGDIDFHDALQKAAAGLRLAIRVDGIRETLRYWIFPVRQIGCIGGFVDRRNGNTEVMGSSLDEALWIWAYEHGVLRAHTIVVTKVLDAQRAYDALRTALSITPSGMKQLPLSIEREGCNVMLLIQALHQAGDSIVWQTQAAPPP